MTGLNGMFVPAHRWQPGDILPDVDLVTHNRIVSIKDDSDWGTPMWWRAKPLTDEEERDWLEYGLQPCNFEVAW